MKADIEDYRAEIDAIDGELLRLLNKRAQLAIAIGALKRRRDAALYDPVRERDVLTRLCATNAGPLDGPAVSRIFRRIIGETRRIEAGAASHAADDAG